MRKLVLVTFIAICSLAFVQANVVSDLIDEGIYSAIDGVIDVKYSEKPKDERECMKKLLRKDKFADKLSSAALKFDNRALRAEMDRLEGDLHTTEIICEWWSFAQTPLGICILIGIILMFLSICIGICKCCCCR